MADEDRMIVNRAPICRTCKYYRNDKRSVEYPPAHKPWWAFWRQAEGPRVHEWEEMMCSIACDVVSGTRFLATCRNERNNPSGCGPEGRNYVANPKWIAAMKEKGLEVHPDLMAMMENAK